MYSKLIVAACALCVGTAFAQSHSITNQANPPGATAASSAATEATPGKNGVKKESKPNGKKKPAKKAGSKEEGAQSAMQQKPSEQTSETEKRAFDKTPQTR